MVHVGSGVKVAESVRMDQLGSGGRECVDERVRRVKSEMGQKWTGSSLRELLPFRDLRKLHKLLILDRLQ
jgi:hypothetical protein